MARRRRGKVIRNFTDKTALDTVVKANQRISELEMQVETLRDALEQCRDRLDREVEGNATQWVALRDIVHKALKT